MQFIVTMFGHEYMDVYGLSWDCDGLRPSLPLGQASHPSTLSLYVVPSGSVPLFALLSHLRFYHVPWSHKGAGVLPCWRSRSNSYRLGFMVDRTVGRWVVRWGKRLQRKKGVDRVLEAVAKIGTSLVPRNEQGLEECEGTSVPLAVSSANWASHKAYLGALPVGLFLRVHSSGLLPVWKNKREAARRPLHSRLFRETLEKYWCPVPTTYPPPPPEILD